MEELGLQERGGFGGENSQVFQVKGVTGNMSRSGHAQEHSDRTGWNVNKCSCDSSGELLGNGHTSIALCLQWAQHVLLATDA